MQVIGVIAEYNPFHSGHLYHLQTLRQQAGEDCAIVCCMSGNWVQRGDAALCDKWTRSGMALRGGADLVLELPTPWAISSAEGFAQGAVSLLHATNVVDTLSFGSEVGALAPLSLLADFLSSPAYPALLRPHLDAGLSFPAARQAAAAHALGHVADLLRHANNNLGVEYLRALSALGSAITPSTIPRRGSSHDGLHPSGDFASASYVRHALLSDPSASLLPYFTQTDHRALTEAGLYALHYAERAVLARLRCMDTAALAALPESGHGLSQRLLRAAETSCRLDTLYDAIKSRRYTHARVRRLVLRAFLGLQSGQHPPLPPYLRVLGMGTRGLALLRRMKKTALLPVLTKPAHVHRLSTQAQQLFSFESRCTSLYALCRNTLDDEHPLSEYRTGPYMDLRST